MVVFALLAGMDRLARVAGRRSHVEARSALGLAQRALGMVERGSLNDVQAARQCAFIGKRARGSLDQTALDRRWSRQQAVSVGQRLAVVLALYESGMAEKRRAPSKGAVVERVLEL